MNTYRVTWLYPSSVRSTLTKDVEADNPDEAILAFNRATGCAPDVGERYLIAARITYSGPEVEYRVKGLTGVETEIVDG